MGWVLRRAGGPANVRTVAEDWRPRASAGRRDIPTAYQYLIIDARGKTLMTDLTGERLARAEEMARAALDAERDAVEIEGGGAGLTYAAFPLQDGGACALVSEYLPQWVSRDLFGVLPNPQNLMLLGAALGSALALGLVAHRASRVIARKMEPLTKAAERIGDEELDFAVQRTNVREINAVLDAMDAMRVSLAASLDARWSAERAQREQVQRSPMTSRHRSPFCTPMRTLLPRSSPTARGWTKTRVRSSQQQLMTSPAAQSSSMGTCMCSSRPRAEVKRRARRLSGRRPCTRKSPQKPSPLPGLTALSSQARSTQRRQRARGAARCDLAYARRGEPRLQRRRACALAR